MGVIEKTHRSTECKKGILHVHDRTGLSPVMGLSGALSNWCPAR